MRKLKRKIAVILIFTLCLLVCSCKNNLNKVNFHNFPKDYKIAYFEELGVKNIPSVNDLFGKNASYNNEFKGTPSYVIINSYKSTHNEFTVEVLLRVKETEYDFFRCNLKFEADDDAQKSFLRYIKVESLLSDQYLEEYSVGLPEEDAKVFDLFLGYMNYIWK